MKIQWWRERTSFQFCDSVCSVMNTKSFTLCSSSSSTPQTISHFSPLQISNYLRRPRKNYYSNKPTKKSSQTSFDTSDQRLNLIIDVENIRNRASTSFRRFLLTSEYKLNRYYSSGNEAFNDFKTLVTVDNNKRLIISCRRSSIWFLANSMLWGFVIIFVFRFIVSKFRFWGFSGGYGNGSFVSKRDRSLGGREVVVGKMRLKQREGKKNKGFDFNVPINPISPSRDMARIKTNDAALQPRKWVSTVEELPQWWPDSAPSTTHPSMKNNQEFQKEANRLIRAIMDNRMCGEDMTGDDIIQFRRICKASGARVHIDTANARDSFYRVSIDFVLNSCCSSASSSTIPQIDDEDPRQFVSGLANSIELQNIRAARIVSAAVAARTRSWFLQALEMQGNRAEALMELSKISLIHQIFPPTESSPEMEMVAQGLEKHLRVEQRKHLFNLLAEFCGPPSKSAAEALGLINKPSAVEDIIN
ncbi:hypothetical protein AQUCO_05800075v1 [Aquilegia coerulea]|uniref:Uncharacterized protein n=1 Tax=Aquilegia coerulea TaxID=218851 RepID=A0A2G5CEL6_AQUCA|nr:hypothetical protein AQUCO_05800075v1 [Aquilegia coerulea]